MRRIGLFLDIQNLYLTVNRKFSYRKLSYKKYMTFLADTGTIVTSYAYGFQIGREAFDFVRSLNALGINTKVKEISVYQRSNESVEQYKKRIDDIRRNYRLTNSLIDMTIGILNHLNDVDTIVLGTTDLNICPLVTWLREKQGKNVIIFAANVRPILKKISSNYMEIFEGLLEDETTNSNRV